MNDKITGSQTNLWGLVLAGGEGKRLETFVQQQRGKNTLLQHIEHLYPEFASRFQGLTQLAGTTAEYRKIKEIYHDLRPLKFSKDILEKIATLCPSAISVLPVLRVTWSDWGSPQRLLEMQKTLELRIKSPAAEHPSQGRRPIGPEIAVGQRQFG